MKTRYQIFGLAVAACALALAGSLSSCTNSVASTDGVAAASSAAPAASKFRHARLLDRATRFEGADGEAVGLVLSLADGATTLTKQRILERYPSLVRYRDFDEVFVGMAVSVPVQRVSEITRLLAADASVRWFEPDVRLAPVLPEEKPAADVGAVEPWGAVYTGADAATPRDGSNVDVYLLDTGVELGAVKGVGGALVGARVHRLEVVGPDGTAAMSALVAAVDLVAEQRRRQPERPAVLNISLGADVGSTAYTSLDDAVAAATRAGVTVVVAAGNDGRDVATYTPAHAAEAVTVGAYGKLYQFASFSNHGTLVDLMAPGVELVATGSDETGSDGARAARPPVAMSGTSMAAAFVTAAAAHHLAAHPADGAGAVEEALKRGGRPEVWSVPSGTTNKTVWMASAH